MITFFRRRGLGNTSCREMARIINEMGGEARVVRNDNLDSIGEDDVVVRWGCTSTIPFRNVTVINNADTIHRCNDKAGARILMQEAGVPAPRTYVGPWPVDALPGTFVARPNTHSQGRNMVVGDWQQVISAISNWCGGYISDYIPKVREVRVLVAQGRVVWVAEKTPADPTAHAWNVAQGGRFDNVRWSDWPISACCAAIMATRALNVDFAGVDVMLDAEGNPYVLEANSAPSQTSPYRQLCSAKALKWMYENGKDRLPHNVDTWKEIIHPAIRS
jgi:glutathione synthase/RimK-type ligase-like ATP-grasp enzyme